MTPLGLAWRSFRGQPARAILGTAGMVAIGALLFDMLMLSRGLVVSLGDLLDHVGFDVRVTATAALPGTGPPTERASELAGSLLALPEVEAVVPLRFGTALTTADGLVNLIGSGGGSRRNWELVEGENLPAAPSPAGEGPEPLVVAPAMADALGLGVGDETELRAPGGGGVALPTVPFRIVGIAEFNFAGAGRLWAATTLPGMARLHGVDESDTADLLLVASAEGSSADEAVAAIRRHVPGVHAFSNAELMARFQDNDFSYFRHISVVLSAITLFFVFVLVTTLLTVSVNQRFGEIAGLRAIGFTRRRVAADLLCESVLLVGVGGLLSLPVGWLIARVLDGILKSMPDFPARLHFFVFEPRAVVLHVSLLGLTGVLAALYPVFLASRLPIAKTLRDEVIG